MHSDDRLGDPVRPTLPLSPLPLIYKILIPYLSVLALAGFVYFSLTMLRQSRFPTGGVGLALAACPWRWPAASASTRAGPGAGR